MAECQNIDALLEQMLLIARRKNIDTEQSDLMNHLNQQLQAELELFFSNEKSGGIDREQVLEWLNVIEELKSFGGEKRKNLLSEVSSLNKGQKSVKKYLLNK
jgi:hypothetical protein